MLGSIKPHGRLLVANFIEELRSRHGLAVDVLAASVRRARSDSWLASVRESDATGEGVVLDPSMTVAAATEAFRTRLGLHVRFRDPRGGDASGRMRLKSLLGQSQESEPAKSARNDQIPITGRKRIATLQREFTAHHSHLGPMLLSSAEYAMSLQGLPIRPISGTMTIAAVRERKSAEDVSIHGNMLVRTLESRFRDVYGLYAQVCVMDDAGRKGYTGGSLDELTLGELNLRQQEKGRMAFRY